MTDVQPETPAAPEETPATPAPAPAPEPEPAAEPVAAPDDPVKAAQDQAAQAAAENEVLQKRVAELAGFQSEAVALRDSVAALPAKVEQLTGDLEAARREASQAQAAALNAATSAGVDQTQVGHARKLAEALKGLLS